MSPGSRLPALALALSLATLPIAAASMDGDWRIVTTARRDGCCAGCPDVSESIVRLRARGRDVMASMFQDGTCSGELRLGSRWRETLTIADSSVDNLADGCIRWSDIQATLRFDTGTLRGSFRETVRYTGTCPGRLRDCTSTGSVTGERHHGPFPCDGPALDDSEVEVD